jgi:hypothetical protein
VDKSLENENKKRRNIRHKYIKKVFLFVYLREKIVMQGAVRSRNFSLLSDH